MKQPGAGEDLREWAPLLATLGAFGVGEGASASLRIGQTLYGAPVQDGITWQPLDLALRLMSGEVVWTGAATGGALTLGIGSVAVAAGSVWAWRGACAGCRRLAGKASASRGRGRVRRQSVDAQARYMARGRELADLRREAVFAKAEQLRVRLRAGDAPGVLIARSVADGGELYGSYEDLHLDIWGPRSGKSTSRVIPAVMEAVGAVVATSNKRDVVDATRAARAQVGQVWVFDPQAVAEEPCTWYWDPIAWVRGEGGAGAQERAAELAGHFAAGEDDAAGGDNFFPQEGEDLLAGLFLACAMGKRPIVQAFAWVTRADDREPIEILDAAGFDLVAAALSDQYTAPDKQRGGVFSTAKKMASCLKYSRIRPWVTPSARGEAEREPFDVEAFVASRDALFPLSEEGKGSAGPLVTALCAAVADAGKRSGRRYPGGRLPVPMLIVLDEAANIVRWKDLPKQYSHFGSRGIVVMTILQSWAQGVRCWGPEGMAALLSAANVLTLGAGLKDTGFLRDMSELVGGHYELTVSTSRSYGKGETSHSASTSRTTEPTLTPSDLAALPKGRVLVFTSGHRATLCEAVPWMARPYARRIQDALDDLDNSRRAAGRAYLRAVPPPADEEDTE